MEDARFVSDPLFLRINAWMKKHSHLDASALHRQWTKDWEVLGASRQDRFTVPPLFSLFENYPELAKQELVAQFGYWKDPSLPALKEAAR